MRRAASRIDYVAFEADTVEQHSLSEKTVNHTEKRHAVLLGRHALDRLLIQEQLGLRVRGMRKIERPLDIAREDLHPRLRAQAV
jgi:hypothetical protein